MRRTRRAGSLDRLPVILFDAGSTLIRREPSEPAVLLRQLAGIGLDVTSGRIERAWYRGETWAGEQLTRENNGAPRLERRQFISGMVCATVQNLDLALSEAGLDNVVSACCDAFDTDRPWQPVPGARATLRELDSRGYRLGLVSNFDSSLRDILQVHEMYDRFSAIVISDEVGVEKPDPSIVRIACKQLGVEPCDSVYVGDHPFDVVCSKQAGARSVWIAPEFAAMPEGVSEAPDWRVTRIEQTLGIFPKPSE
jgi:putative hydrolase of the HAD superfamily